MVQGTIVRQEDFNNLKILVVGDLMLDEYVIGKKYGISDEAPVPILKVDDFEIRLGGAANVAHNLTSLGCNVLLCGSIGRGGGSLQKGGFSARRFLQLLADNNITSDYIVQADCMTTTKTRVLINGHQVVRYDYEQTNLNESIKQDLCSKIKLIDFSEIDLILISDYSKGVICKEVVSLLKHTEKRIIVDPKPHNKHLYYNVYCLTPNVREFAKMQDFSADDDREELMLHAKRFMKQYSVKCLVITLGIDGALYCSCDESSFLEGRHQEVINIIGAGDTFVSTFALLVAAGNSEVEAIKYANIAASIVVSKRYTSTVSWQEIERERSGT